MAMIADTRTSSSRLKPPVVALLLRFIANLEVLSAARSSAVRSSGQQNENRATAENLGSSPNQAHVNQP
jgi:hypothetical protein